MTMSLRTICAFICFSASIAVNAEHVNMQNIGAKADGKTINTQLINSTIERLSSAGGGTLFFPSGKYLTGSIHLKSNITIELEIGRAHV